MKECNAGEMNGICQFHNLREGELNELRSAVGKTSGQLKLLVAGFGMFCSLLVGYMGFSYNTQESVRQSVASIDKSISTYVSKHEVEYEALRDRVGKTEDGYRF